MTTAVTMATSGDDFGSILLHRAREYEGPDLLTPEEAAPVLGVSSETVRRWTKVGKIPVHPRPLDGRQFVSMAEIREALTPGGPVWKRKQGEARNPNPGEQGEQGEQHEHEQRDEE